MPHPGCPLASHGPGRWCSTARPAGQDAHWRRSAHDVPVAQPAPSRPGPGAPGPDGTVPAARAEQCAGHARARGGAVEVTTALLLLSGGQQRQHRPIELLIGRQPAGGVAARNTGRSAGRAGRAVHRGDVERLVGNRVGVGGDRAAAHRARGDWPSADWRSPVPAGKAWMGAAPAPCGITTVTPESSGRDCAWLVPPLGWRATLRLLAIRSLFDTRVLESTTGILPRGTLEHPEHGNRRQGRKQPLVHFTPSSKLALNSSIP